MVSFTLFLAITFFVAGVALALRRYVRHKLRCCHRAEYTDWSCSACWGGICEYHAVAAMHPSGVEVQLCPSCKKQHAGGH